MKILDIEGNKDNFLFAIRSYVKRSGVDKLCDYLISSDFFIAPCSSKYHLSYPGGLCQHSLNVFNRLIKEVELEWGSIEESPYSMESIAIVSLLHDLCKIDFYKKGTRNVKNEDTGRWEKVDIYIIEEKLPICHSYKSQYIVRSYINLTREESVAIMSHMGGFDATVQGGDQTISKAFEKYPLALLLHVADLKASKLDESNLEN